MRMFASVGCALCLYCFFRRKLTPVNAVVLLMQELSQKLVVVDGVDDLSKEAQRNATTTFMTHLRATLASKRVLGEYRSAPGTVCRAMLAGATFCLSALQCSCC